ncbi:MAG: 16S rRNA (guanine(527)-N(7))-methyltransferase RsmG [Bacilli bacterium]|nr:16S rRNA (guanine(527)-N(7))-methyltransferase RsmG [Bacilli bacterium]
MTIDKLKELLSEIGITLTKKQGKQLHKYYDLVIEANEHVNLTRITEKDDFYLKHFYDSLTLIKAIDLNQEMSVLDFGTGAGFPGIVLKICFPNLNITLVDALEKRCNFLKKVIEELELTDIEVIHTRGEDYAKRHREKYDLVVSRAVANLNTLVEICLPMVKVNGYFVAMKGNAEDEVKSSMKAIELLESRLEDVISFNLPIEDSVRNLVKIKKLGKNKRIYPRNFDQIKKRPLK